jgi:hypothetical protein
MTAFRVHDRVKLPDGSIGTLQHINPDGTWRVWFNGKDWQGDRKEIGKDTLVKKDVRETEMEHL